MISGNFKDRFSESNLAVVTGVHMNSDAPKWIKFKIINTDTIEYEHPNAGFSLGQIEKDSRGEYFTIEHSGLYERLFQKGKPSSYKVRPFFNKA